MNTLQMEFLFCQGLLPSFSGTRSMLDEYITCSRIAVGGKRLKEEFGDKMYLWITCSRISRKSVSTKNVGKRRFQLANYLHLSRLSLKRWTIGKSGSVSNGG